MLVLACLRREHLISVSHEHVHMWLKSISDFSILFSHGRPWLKSISDFNILFSHASQWLKSIPDFTILLASLVCVSTLIYCISVLMRIPRDAGTGGAMRGSRPPCLLPGGARGTKVPFQFKELPWRNSESSEMSVQFFYEFASENARNAVNELQDSTVAWRRMPLHPYHPINRKHD